MQIRPADIDVKKRLGLMHLALLIELLAVYKNFGES